MDMSTYTKHTLNKEKEKEKNNTCRDKLSWTINMI